MILQGESKNVLIKMFLIKPSFFSQNVERRWAWKRAKLTIRQLLQAPRMKQSRQGRKMRGEWEIWHID